MVQWTEEVMQEGEPKYILTNFKKILTLALETMVIQHKIGAP